MISEISTALSLFNTVRSLLGGGNKGPSPEQMATNLLNDFERRIRGIEEGTQAYADKWSADTQDRLDQFRASYTNPRTIANFKGNISDFVKTANDAVNNGIWSAKEASNWLENKAYTAGIRPGDALDDKGTTLDMYSTAFDKKELSMVPEKWNQSIGRLYKTYMNRDPSNDELKKYDGKTWDYDINNVTRHLANYDRDFYRNNLSVLNPSAQANADFFGGIAFYTSPEARKGLDPKTGKPVDASNNIA